MKQQRKQMVFTWLSAITKMRRIVPKYLCILIKLSSATETYWSHMLLSPLFGFNQDLDRMVEWYRSPKLLCPLV